MRENSEIVEELCAFADALFRDVNIAQILGGHTYFDSVSCHDAADLLFKRQKRYEYCSKLECEHIADSVSRYICDKDARQMRSSRHGTIHVFELLSDLADLLLTQDNGEVRCRYTNILHWRNLIQSIGEELPVTAMYAIKDMEYGRPPRTDFTWDYVTRHNNEMLNRLLRRGVSEHHMHLWASTPYFQISWLNLMNKAAFSPYIRSFERINSEDWGLEQRWPLREGPDASSSFALMYQQAALIRVYLCARLKGRSFLDQRTGESGAAEQGAFVLRLLRNPQLLQLELSRIQAWISALREPGSAPCIDYALRLFPFTSGQEEHQVFSGERWFLYSMLQDIYQTVSSLEREEHNLFYAYLLLQVQIRCRLVQVDDKSGFDHFQRIQRRKSYFLGGIEEKRLIMRLAVWAPLLKAPHLLEVEARIVPPETLERLFENIAQLESVDAENGGGSEADSLKKRYYYVLSFAKEDDGGADANSGELFEYRHYRYRQKLERQGRTIRMFRELYPTLAQRVRGIDACSQEIGCRPENFAFLFRMLGSHTQEADSSLRLPRPPKLWKTYHVGEDFLDLVDGLRAIDEAVNFLNLSSGDRLGHALALSLEPRDWYERKNGQISLRKQDYLDNVAWLYLMIRQHRIPEMEQAVLYLKAQFQYYFRQIYLNHIDEEDVEQLVKSGEERYQGKPFARNYVSHKLSFSIEDYCRGWMLRGDHPELYKTGYFWEHELLADGWSRFKVNEAFPVDSSVRYIPECSFLNFCYHYNSGVRKTGAEYITVTVTREYIQCAEAVQRALQSGIAKRGLSVECNPTSNMKISTFRWYDKHPIVRLYNKGLVHSKEELRQCPQISDSLNTDDSGVFFTSLESEYAVMARALEVKGEEAMYCNWEIYDWLDGIRELGNAQSFQAD